VIRRFLISLGLAIVASLPALTALADGALDRALRGG